MKEKTTNDITLEDFRQLICTSYNWEKVKAANPVLFETVAGFEFYEHPTHGDEAPLIIRAVGADLCGLSHWWEVPDELELLDAL